MDDALPLSRVMIIAPHPDDETIGAGGLIQRVVAAHGELRVVFITNGDNNLFPIRATTKKWHISERERAAWGAMRRDEALHALEKLGAHRGTALFLNYPDRALLGFEREGNTAVTDSLRALVDVFDPTLIVSPSRFDLHADHRGAALFTHQAAGDRTVVTYVVHGNAPEKRIATKIELSANERETKRAAIECHASQLRLSRDRFLSYAGASETFYTAERDKLRTESVYWRLRCKTLHGWRVLTRKGAAS